MDGDINDLLKRGRKVWGNERLSLDEIIIRLNVVLGDISRLSRDAAEKGKELDQQALKKELGNTIFSMIRWCDDLGYRPEECIGLAVKAQKQYQKETGTRGRQ